MSDIKDQISSKVDDLRRIRDELRVQLDLGKKDAEDAWAGIEHKWQEVEGKLGVIEKEGLDAAKDIAAATEVLLDEIRDGFDRVRKLI